MEDDVERLREAEQSLREAIDDLARAAFRCDGYCPDMQDRIKTAIAALAAAKREIESGKVRP